MDCHRQLGEDNDEMRDLATTIALSGLFMDGQLSRAN